MDLVPPGEKIKTQYWGMKRVLVEGKVVEVPALARGLTVGQIYRNYRGHCADQKCETLGWSKFNSIIRELTRKGKLENN